MKRAQVLKALSTGPAKKRFAHVDMAIHAPTFTISGRGDMAYSRTSPAVRLEVVGSCLCYDNTEVVVKDHVYYVNLPSLMPDGRYVRLDPQSSSSPLGPDFAKISDELDSLSVLLDMRPGFRKVHYTGRRMLYGHPMSSYALTVDARAGLAARGLASHVGEVPPRIVYHLLFDEHRLLRKMTWQVGRMRMTSEMSDWGKRVRVRAPGPRKVIGLGDLAALRNRQAA